MVCLDAGHRGAAAAVSADRYPAARRTSRSSAPITALSPALDRGLLLPGHGCTVDGSSTDPGPMPLTVRSAFWAEGPMSGGGPPA